MKANSILETIGQTPHVQIQRLFPELRARNIEVWMKIERFNPGGSIKDRIALAMVEAAERSGELRPGMTIIEPTSGNTGVGLAMVAAVKGYKLTLVMPESMSIERRRLMLAYGATLELTPKEKGMSGAVARAKEMVATTAGSWMPLQFDNPTNVAIHKATTVQEILADFPEGLDAIVTGIGTGGHITAIGELLKEHFPQLKIFGVEPADSPVLSGGKAGPHPIQGIGAGFVPTILNRSVVDQIVTITKEEAFRYTQRVAKEEGIFVGISSGASLAAIAKVASELTAQGRVLTLSYDTGERYLSIEGLF